MCNTIHNVPTRAAATKFHPVQYSNFFLLFCLGCSRWAHSLWSKIHNEFYTCNTLLFLLLSIIIIFFFMKFVFVITRHSLLMGGSTAVQKNMTDCRSNSNILKLTSHVMGKNSFVLIPKDLNYLKKYIPWNNQIKCTHKYFCLIYHQTTTQQNKTYNSSSSRTVKKKIRFQVFISLSCV